MAVILHVHWDTGQGCTASVETLAAGSKVRNRSRTSTILVDLQRKGIITRNRQRHGTALTALSLANRDVHPVGLKPAHVNRLTLTSSVEPKEQREKPCQGTVGGCFF